MLVLLYSVDSVCISFYVFFFFKQKTAYEMRISDWSSDVCSSDLCRRIARRAVCAELRRSAHRRGHRQSRLSAESTEGWRTTLGHDPPRPEVHRSGDGRASCRERVCQYV